MFYKVNLFCEFEISIHNLNTIFLLNTIWYYQIMFDFLSLHKIFILYSTHPVYRVHYELYKQICILHHCLQENPTPSRCLGVFGLSLYTTEQQIHHIFSKYGPVDKVQVVIDAKVSVMSVLLENVNVKFDCRFLLLCVL